MLNKRMTKEKTLMIIDRFNNYFPDQMEFETEVLILNEIGSFDNLIIVPKEVPPGEESVDKLTPERLMFELEKVIEINSFIKPNEFYEKFDMVRRESRAYVILLENFEGEIEKENSATLFEGLVGFLLGGIKENFCTGSLIKDEPEKYPYFLHNEEEGGLLIINKAKEKNKFLRAKRIIKVIIF